MKTMLRSWLLVVCTTLLFACSDNDNDVRQPAPTPVATPAPAPTPAPANVRVTHASFDAPAVNVLVNNAAALENVGYQVSSGWQQLTAAETSFQVDARLPGDATAAVINATLTLESGKSYEVIALGKVADGSAGSNPLEALVITNEGTAVTAGNARAQVVHAAPDAPRVDIYVTAVDAALSDSQPLATASYKENTAQVEVTAGDYQVRITPEGDKQTVVFDSGALTLADGADLLILATPNVAAGTSPVALLIADGTSSSVVLDKNAGANLRVIHAVADAPEVDVFADGNEAVSALAFKGVTGYLNLPEGDRTLRVAAAADNSVVVINDATVNLNKGSHYSVLAVGELTQSSINPAVLQDMPRRVATAAQVRVIHASPAAGNVDIYVTATSDISAVEPNFAAVPFTNPQLAETGYVALAAGQYVVTVTAAGTKQAAIGPLELSFDANKIYTVIATDNTGGGLPPGIITLDDF